MNIKKLTSLTTSIFRLINRFGLAAINLLVLATIAWFILKIYPGDRWTLVRLGSYFAPWLFMGLLLSIPAALAARRRWLTGVIAILLALFWLNYHPELTPTPQPVQAGAVVNQEDALRVMSFNVNYNNRNVAGVAELIRAESPDLIAFQEMMPEFFESLRSKLSPDYPYALIEGARRSPALLSRYPLTAQPEPAEAWRAQHALVELPAGPVVIWNLHPAPAIAKAWEQQRQVFEAVEADIAQETGPLIVLGDFNATPDSDNFRLIGKHLTDVHQSAGQGFGFTFPDFSKAIAPDQPWYLRALLSVPPVVRIDHILVSQHFEPQSIKVLPTGAGSDHLPVVATLGVRK